MQSNKPYIKKGGDFIGKIEDIQYIPSNAILVTLDVLEICPSIPHDSGLKAVKSILDKQKKSKYTNRIPEND